MSTFYSFLIDPRGRTDRIGYVLSQLGLWLWLIILTSLLRARLDDFSGSGALLDTLVKRDWADYRELLEQTAISLNTFVTIGVLALHALGLWSWLSMTARRLQDMGRPGVYAAAVLLTGPGGVFLLAMLPGDRDDNAYGPAPRRRFQPRARSGGDPVVTGPNTR